MQRMHAESTLISAENGEMHRDARQDRACSRWTHHLPRISTVWSMEYCCTWVVLVCVCVCDAGGTIPPRRRQ